MTGSENLPLWDLTPIFPGLDSPAWISAKAQIARLGEDLLAQLSSLGPAGSPGLSDWLEKSLELGEKTSRLYTTLGAYAYSCYSTATRDPLAMAELNAIEELALPLKRAEVLNRNALASRKEEILALVTGPGADPRFVPYRFHLEEEIFLQSRQMAPELEDLAADLLRSGGDAWGRLQEAVSSNTSVSWEERTGERKTIVELRNLAYDPDRKVREKAYRLELEAWKSVEIPVAAALNGVKGFTVSLNTRRGWNGAIDKSITQCRITRASLDALLGAMEDSLPAFHRYLSAKASFLGLPKLGFYDIFGPLVSESDKGRTWTWEEAQAFIVGKFSAFDPGMGAFADRAFRESWIDAQPREGKVGGAYCIHFPEARVPRVLCNFDGTFSDIITVAHELGHAWHYDCIKGQPQALAQYPMTLAETASIFAETLVFEAAISGASEAERLGLLELHLQDTTQVIVDILSRYRFETQVFSRRDKGEVPAQEFCSLMAEAQKACYGEALDPGLLHPYMWAAKGHYYSPELAFYNFPYAFGLLFGLGLYARYQQEGPEFAASYRSLLAATGSASAVEITRQAGFDIESKAFWKSGLDVIAGQVAQFERLVATAGGKNN